jgi:hypothetical protein
VRRLRNFWLRLALVFANHGVREEGEQGEQDHADHETAYN